MHESLRTALAGAAWYNTGGREFDFAALGGRATAIMAFSFDPAGLLAWRTLAGLAARLGTGFICLGVHVAPASLPLEREALRKSLRRYEIFWPVAGGIDAPADLRPGELVLLGPGGAEAWRGPLSDCGAVASLVSKWQARGELDLKPFELSPEEELRHDDVLHFPEGIDALDRRLYLADTGADRVIGAYVGGDDPIAQVEWVAGGMRGLADGPLDEARFDGPRGLCAALDGGALYVADSMNNAIRAIDLENYTVRTLCAGLRLPWDVCVCGGAVYAALPLQDEICRVDLETCGSAPLMRARAPLALTASGTRVWVLESGGGLVWCDVVSGAEGRLALNRELPGAAGLTQLADGALCIADQIDNTMFRVDPASGEVAPFSGKGRGHVDGPRPRFFAPMGLARMSRTLLVADCFNHALRAVAEDGRGAGSVTLFAAS